jgi:hypothetical protein
MFRRHLIPQDSKPAPALLFLAEYTVEKDAPSFSQMELTAFPGLLLLHAVRCPSSVKVITYWNDEAYFRCFREHFESKINASGTTVCGPIYNTTEKGKSIWARIPLYTAILAIVAFLGAAKSLFDHFDWIFADPDIAIMVEPTKTNVVEGENFVSTVTITNRASVPQSDILLNVFLKAPAEGKLILDFPESKISNLNVGASYTFKVSGRAIVPGEFTLGINVSARAGWARPIKVIPAENPIAVWPNRPHAAVFTDSEHASTGVLRSRILAGRASPKGMECELEIRNVNGLHYNGEGQWVSNHSHGKEVYVLRFRASQMDDFESQEISHKIESASPKDWKIVAERSNVVCRNTEVRYETH